VWLKEKAPCAPGPEKEEEFLPLASGDEVTSVGEKAEAEEGERARMSPPAERMTMAAARERRTRGARNQERMSMAVLRRVRAVGVP